MDKFSSQPSRSPLIVPLARDASGNQLDIPDSAVGWRIRRQTGGRPKVQLDSKKQPMLFPLDYTIPDAEDILAPGSYLLDLVDKNGDSIGVTIALTVQPPRNAAPDPDDKDDDPGPARVSAMLPVTTSEVRLVLEANVRSTQLAFQHNERTLELALRMAETLRDGVQVLASAQADWIKSVSSARGFFRNTAQPLPPLEVKQLTVHTGGEEDGEDDDSDGDEGRDEVERDPAAPAHWSAAFAPILQTVVQQAGPAVMAWAAKQQAGGGGSRIGGNGGSRVSSDDTPTRWEARDFLHLRSAQQKGAAHRAKQAADKRAAEEAAEERAAGGQAMQDAAAAAHAAKLIDAIAVSWSPVLGLDIPQLLRMLPEQTVSKMMAVQAALSPDEQADAMQILRHHDAEGLADLLGVFDAATLEQATDFLRRLVVDWRAARVAVTKPPTNGGGAGGSTPP